MGFVNEKTEDGTWRTIDKERDIVLLCDGKGGADDPYGFSLIFEGYTVLFDAWLRHKTTENKKSDVTWIIVRMWFPEYFENRKTEVFSITEEAIQAFGAYFSWKNVELVSIVFSPDLYLSITRPKREQEGKQI